MCTKYEEHSEAKCIFDEVERRLPLIAANDKNAIEVSAKFFSFASSVSNKETFKDMIKILWRTVKVKSGQPQYKLCLFLVGMSSLIKGVNTSFNKDIEDWVKGIAQWLGNQLTIGGKGITGEGEGKVVDRINRFFLTPYLHDFD